MSEGPDWEAVYELVGLQKKYLARGTVMNWTINADPGYEDLSAPELETEYDGKMTRVQPYPPSLEHEMFGMRDPYEFLDEPCSHASAYGNTSVCYGQPGYDNRVESTEINEGFLPSEKGSVWKENEDEEPELETEYDGRMLPVGPPMQYVTWENCWRVKWGADATATAVVLTDYERTCHADIEEISEGFLPSEKGSVWKKNEDEEPEHECVTTIRCGCSITKMLRYSPNCGLHCHWCGRHFAIVPIPGVG